MKPNYFLHTIIIFFITVSLSPYLTAAKNKKHIKFHLPQEEKINLENQEKLLPHELVSYIAKKFKMYFINKVNLRATQVNNDVLELCLIHLKNDLKVLLLSYTDVGDQGVMTLCNQCPCLEKLELANCRNIIELSLENKSLNDLSLAYTKVTDLTVAKIVVQCSALKTLDLTGCTNISNPILMSNSLTDLYLNDTNITKQALEGIIRNCPNLKNIYLKHAKHVTKQYIKQLQSNLLKITLYI